MRKRNNAQKCLHAVFFCIVCVREREEAGGGRVCACACLDFLYLQVIL